MDESLAVQALMNIRVQGVCHLQPIARSGYRATVRHDGTRVGARMCPRRVKRQSRRAVRALKAMLVRRKAPLTRVKAPMNQIMAMGATVRTMPATAMMAP